MRDIPFEGEFDAIINIFTAFGYFDDDAEDQKVLNAVAKALKPEGQFLIDLINAVRIIRDFRPQGWQQLSGGGFALTQRDYNLLTGNNEEHRGHIAPRPLHPRFSVHAGSSDLVDIKICHVLSAPLLSRRGFRTKWRRF